VSLSESWEKKEAGVQTARTSCCCQDGKKDYIQVKGDRRWKPSLGVFGFTLFDALWTVIPRRQGFAFRYVEDGTT